MAFFCKNGMSNIGPVLSVFTRHARMDVTKVEFSDLHYLSRYIKQFPSWKVFLRDNQSKTLGLVCLLIGIGFIIVFICCILTKSSIKISLNSYNYTYVTVAHKLNITGYMGPVILPTSYYVYLLQTTFQSICCPDYTSRRCRSKCLPTMYLSSDPLQLLLEFGSNLEVPIVCWRWRWKGLNWPEDPGSVYGQPGAKIGNEKEVFLYRWKM